jgi:hypothetical protein
METLAGSASGRAALRDNPAGDSIARVSGRISFWVAFKPARVFE